MTMILDFCSASVIVFS